MTRFAIAVGLTTACIATAAWAETPPIMGRAEACLRANVDRVVAVEPDLQSAATFLVNFACAEPTAGAARYERNVALLGTFSAMSSTLPKGFEKSAISMRVDATVDPETGHFVIAPPKPGEQPSPLTAMLPQMSANAGMMLPDTAPVSLRRLAGELVLAAREKQKTGSRR